MSASIRRVESLRAALVRLADAAEAAVGSERDMPSYDSTMDEFESALHEARSLAVSFPEGER